MGLHFFLVSQAPILNKEAAAKVSVTVQELTKQAYGARNFYSNVKPDDGKYLAASFQFRGAMETQEVDNRMKILQESNAEDFVEWIPNNIKNGIICTPQAN